MGMDRDVMVGALWALFYRPIPHLLIPMEKRPGHMRIGTLTYWTGQIVSFWCGYILGMYRYIIRVFISGGKYVWVHVH